MRIENTYSFKGGEEIIKRDFSKQWEEIKQVIASVNAQDCKNKTCQEHTNVGAVLYSPRCLNAQFEILFNSYGWAKKAISCVYSYDTVDPDKVQQNPHRGPAPYREIDFVSKEAKIGAEVQFGKYAFMAYDICAKMPIFNKEGIIDVGVEIVPTKHLAEEMSTGVSYFDQIAWDLGKRGPSEVDIPVLVLGVDV